MFALNPLLGAALAVTWIPVCNAIVTHASLPSHPFLTKDCYICITCKGSAIACAA